MSVFNILNWVFQKEMEYSWYHQQLLKMKIKHRLATEDYTCRMVDPGPYKLRPRIRYRLTKQRHRVKYCGWVFYDLVYK